MEEQVDDRQGHDGNVSRITMAAFPRKRPTSTGGAELASAVREGRRPKIDGVIGYAPFVIVDENLQPLGAAMVIASTRPLTLTDYPGHARPLDVNYKISQFGSLQVGVSENARLEDFSDAVASIESAALRPFVGNMLFLTFSTTVEVDIVGPSMGLATYVAVNALTTNYYFTGEVVIEEGLLALRPIAAFESKLSMIKDSGSVIVTPYSLQNLEVAMAAGVKYITPQQVAVGVIRDSGPNNTCVIFVQDLASVYIVAEKSSTGALRASAVESSAQRGGLGGFTNTGEPKLMVKLNDFYLRAVVPDLTAEQFRAKIETWRKANWPGHTRKEYEKVVDVQTFWENKMTESEWESFIAECIKEPPYGLGLNMTRILGAISRKDVERIELWKSSLRTTKPKTKVAKPVMNQPKKQRTKQNFQPGAQTQDKINLFNSIATNFTKMNLYSSIGVNPEEVVETIVHFNEPGSVVSELDAKRANDMNVAIAAAQRANVLGISRPARRKKTKQTQTPRANNNGQRVVGNDDDSNDFQFNLNELGMDDQSE